MEIQRTIIDKFKAWKEADSHKPILLMGARQIGKTWAMKRFGAQCFEHTAIFDFDRQPELRSAFINSKEPERIIRELSIYCDVPLVPGRTLVVFDEIQECEEALNALKYFNEDAPQWHIIAAGSMLGVAVKHRRMAVPVGKVEVMRMYPVSFREFLSADDPAVASYLDGMDEPAHLPEIMLNKVKAQYRRYMVCGGMPEAAKAMLDGEGMEAIDGILRDILGLYELDFSRYAEPRDIPRIHAIWHSLPSQLSKENRKFIYKVVRTGARSKDYEDALLWLEDAGMIHRVKAVSKPAMPLSAYENVDSFKVYACDCGLLRRLAGLPGSVVSEPTAGYTEFKGAMAENAVLQCLLPASDGTTPHYWTSEGKAEIEFLMQHGTGIVPIEVKAENCIGGRSLAVYDAKYHPKNRIRFSSLNLQRGGNLLSCPSPLAEWASRWLLPE